MTEPLDCVLDASVGIKLFIAEALSDHAHALFAHVADDPPVRFFVPDLFYIECTNILWKYVKRLGLTAEDARLCGQQLGLLALTSFSTAALMIDALDFAIVYDITAYDAVYAALAQQLATPLMTADARLARSMSAAPIDVRWLGDPAVSRML